jgi:hypothetical protein
MNKPNKISLGEYRQYLLDAAEDASIERDKLDPDHPSMYHMGLETAYTIALSWSDRIDVNKPDPLAEVDK